MTSDRVTKTKAKLKGEDETMASRGLLATAETLK